ncbi:HpcH/HpaI aldolase/citrate lyase family protein [Ralstonia solanacearum]|uniref:HpcH/HpaI aldolase/citrate lyase family protein n=1 Tax=Ralstonia solanacearum TaxID=305 RepID=UPI0006DCC25F|nr:CoA ester lyase [Ralstonia solanacearum]
MSTPRSARSYLFVPADRPERFAKAQAAGADAVILDLEDAVSSDDKDRARHHLADYLDAGGTGIVRINGIGTPWCDDDLRLCTLPGVRAIVVPKAGGADDVAAVRACVPAPVALLPLIETARGMAHANAIAAAQGVARLLFGTVDFRTELGIDGDEAELLAFRSMLVLASALAGIEPPVDGVTLDLDDVAALQAACARSRRLGFGAKLCIHPRQVGTVNQAFGPSAAELEWARRVIERAGSSPGAFQLDGKMVDAPVIQRAARLLRLAGGSAF